MTTWTQIDFGERVKFHAVPAELRTALLADMEARNHVPTATFFHPGWQIEEPLSEWHLDLGGGVFVGEPFVEITIDGLLVSCRAYQIEAVVRRCRKFELTRAFATGQAYHKIHTWPNHSLVVTPTQYSAIIDGLTARIPEANAQLDVFEAVQDGRRATVEAARLLTLTPAIDKATFKAIRDQIRGMPPLPQTVLPDGAEEN